MPKNIAKGKLATSHLVDLLGPEVTIMESQRFTTGDGRWRFYLSTSIGPIHLNCRRGQEMCLANGRMFGSAEEVADAEDKLTADDPGYEPTPAPGDDEPAPADPVKKSAGYFVL